MASFIDILKTSKGSVHVVSRNFKGVTRKFLRLLKGSFRVSHVYSDVSVTLLRTLESKAYFVKDSASMFSHYETPSAPFRIF